jgi:hypothetical protein
MQDGVNRLSNSCSGWKSQKYLTFGSSVAYYWGDSLKAAQSSMNFAKRRIVFGHRNLTLTRRVGET